jgi:CRISPR-associated protein (TIGR03986 family)
MITAPYNFVPLSDRVVSPHWAKYVSNDIPFKDSESGVLDLTIKAESPIYVRNGVPKDASDEDKKAFNNIDSHYFIPGSSIKGMLRSVMEIMTFGRISNKVNDYRYSVRDFQNNDIYPKSDLATESLCGWLFKINEEYYVEDCGKPGRISHKTLDTLCSQNAKISEYYKKAESITPKTKSAKSKYELFPFKKYGYKFKLDFTDVNRPIYKIDEEGEAAGTIVFSGQASVRKEPIDEKASGKHLEFIFFDSNNEPILLSYKVLQNFFFAYFDHDRNQQNDDWKWRKPQLETGKKIPVFFRKNLDGTIKDIGLTLLYKIIYEYSIKDSINHCQKNADAFDMAETIFGYSENKYSLKGRVHIGHAFVKNAVIPLPEKTEVLASPKASYYPNYVEQKNTNGVVTGEYLTYMNSTCKIRGWKRYPIRNSNEPINNNNGTDNISSKFKPLPPGTEFTLQIYFHNLRKEELGALVSSITFHNTAGLYHSIGSAKPLGYGKTSIAINNMEEQKKKDVLKCFELYMDCELKHSSPLWFQLPQIKELFAMAKPGLSDEKLKYMTLADFAKAKGNRGKNWKYSLQQYSSITNQLFDVTTLGSRAEIIAAKEYYTNEKILFAEKQDIEGLKEIVLDKHKSILEKALEEKKKELLAKLHLKKEKVAEKEEQEKFNQIEALKREKAATGLPQEWLNLTDFGNLANRVPAWQNKLPNKVISESFKNDLIKLLTKIIRFELTIKKKIKDWEGSFESNKNYKKITDWVGELKAKALFDELNRKN